MPRELHKLMATLLLLAGLLSPGFAHGLQMPDYSETERQYQQTIGKRQGLMQRLRNVEDDYQTLVRQIDQLKSSGGMSTIAGRLELQNLLSRSKSVADQLDALQNEVRSLDTRLQGQRSTLVTGIDSRMRELEKSLGAASPRSRAAIVDELNSLRRQRVGLSEPAPSGPSQGQVKSALRLAEEVADHPDELMAAADELQDTEDQLRRRLAAIQTKLGELRETKTLVRRARSFSREERFFEETDRSRVIARFDRETRVPKARDETPTPTAAPESGGAEEPASGNNGVFEGADEDMAGAPAADFDSAEGARQEAPMTDAPDDAEVAAPPSPSSDPFETTRETIVIGGGSDPARSVGGVGTSVRDVDQQIRSLEEEQERLDKQAAQLKKRAAQLRKRAQHL